MPLSKAGKKLLKSFEKKYGHDKGVKIFYSWEHKHPDFKFLKGGKKK